MANPVAHASHGLLCHRDEAVLRSRIDREPLRAAWAQVRASWRSAREHILAAPEDKPYSYGMLASYSPTPAVIHAALDGRWTGDAEAIDFVVQAVHRLDRIVRAGGVHTQAYGEISLAADLLRRDLPDATRQTLLDLARDHMIDAHGTDRPLKYNGGGGNVSLARTMNAAVTAMVWGDEADHPRADDVVNLACEGLRMYLRRGVDPQGHGYEWVGYLHCVAHHLYLFAELHRQQGRGNLFAEQPGLARIPNASRELLLPDRSSLINIGDHGTAFPWTMPWLLLTARHYGRPQDLALWNAFCGPDHPRQPFGDITPWYEAHTDHHHPELTHAIPSAALALLWWDEAFDKAFQDGVGPRIEQHPIPLATHSPGTEIATFRSSEAVDGVFVNLLGSGRSHSSLTHAHPDAGHLSVFAHGEYLAIDTGRYNSLETHHSVMVVDGEPSIEPRGNAMPISPRAGRVERFESPDSSFEYAKVDAAHMKNARWADRHVLFLRYGEDQAYLAVFDNLNRDDAAHAFHWQLQAQPDAQVTVTSPVTAEVRLPQARLDVTFLPPSTEDFPDHPYRFEARVETRHWPFGEDKAYAIHRQTWLTTTTCRWPCLVGQLDGLSGLLATVWAPRRNGQDPLAIENQSTCRTTRFTIQHADGARDTIIAGLDHGMIRQHDLDAEAELIVLRWNPAGELVTAWTDSGETIRWRTS